MAFDAAARKTSGLSAVQGADGAPWSAPRHQEQMSLPEVRGSPHKLGVRSNSQVVSSPSFGTPGDQRIVAIWSVERGEGRRAGADDPLPQHVTRPQPLALLLFPLSLFSRPGLTSLS